MYYRERNIIHAHNGVHPITVTILGPIGSTLQHPQPRLAQTSFGTMLPFHTVPTSLPTTVPSDMIPQQHMPRSGTSPYRTRSTHPSLYEKLRNLLPAPHPISTHQGAVGGGITEDPRTVHHEQVLGSNSPDNSENSHSLHQSYSRPLSCAMTTGQARQAPQTLPTSHHVSQHPSPT